MNEVVAKGLRRSDLLDLRRSRSVASNSKNALNSSSDSTT